jgi:hypothetical protein
VNNIPTFANWVQIKMDKTLKITCINHKLYFKIIFIFHFLCSWKMFKVWILILKFTLFKYFIFWLNQFHVNYKPHVFKPTIIMYHTNVLKTLKFLSSVCYLRMHDSQLSAFMFHLFIQFNFRFNGVLNNILFMVWNLDIKL